MEVTYLVFFWVGFRLNPCHPLFSSDGLDGFSLPWRFRDWRKSVEVERLGWGWKDIGGNGGALWRGWNENGLLHFFHAKQLNQVSAHLKPTLSLTPLFAEQRSKYQGFARWKQLPSECSWRTSEQCDVSLLADQSRAVGGLLDPRVEGLFCCRWLTKWTNAVRGTLLAAVSQLLQWSVSRRQWQEHVSEVISLDRFSLGNHLANRSRLIPVSVY